MAETDFSRHLETLQRCPNIGVSKLVGFLAPKAAEDPSDCSDKIAVSSDQKTIAVADGVTTSFRGGVWASFLVKAFVQNPPMEESNLDWFNAAKAEWGSHLDALRKTLLSGDISLSRIQEREPGAATIVTLQMEQNASAKTKMKITACGDACVLMYRNDNLAYSAPMQNAEDFNNFPKTINSNSTPQNISSLLLHKCLDLQDGDTIFLATDSMAKLLLSDKNDITRRCCHIENEHQFLNFVSEQRQHSPETLNDDITLVRFRLGSQGLPKSNFEKALSQLQGRTWMGFQA